MVDIHSHILWGMDDGARTIEESEAMLHMAARYGTTDIVATPHADMQYTYAPDLVNQRMAELQGRVGKSIRIHRGCDFHLKIDNIREAIENPAKYSVNGNGWLLVEFSDWMIIPNTEEIFNQLESAGMRIIVTHPERNALLRGKFDRLENWVHSGAYLQITAQSVLGYFGGEARRFSEKLLDNGLVHFVASDAHDLERRMPRLDLAFWALAERYSEEYATALMRTYPMHVVEGSRIAPGPLAPPARRKKWFQFW